MKRYISQKNDHFLPSQLLRVLKNFFTDFSHNIVVLVGNYTIFGHVECLSIRQSLELNTSGVKIKIDFVVKLAFEPLSRFNKFLVFMFTNHILSFDRNISDDISFQALTFFLAKQLALYITLYWYELMKHFLN
jgi:hypothetical protein